MSKMSKEVRENRAEAKLHRVTNFMGGSSFELTPLQTLRLVACSSIFGEPQYYRGTKDRDLKSDHTIDESYDSIIGSRYNGMSTSQVFEKVIDEALSDDFLGTLEFAKELRRDFYMRLNPQVIMVRAAIHPDRKRFTDEHPGLFHKINRDVMRRADEPATQITYYLHLKGDKNKMPSVLKRSIADKLSSLNAYAVNKYKNSEIGMINAVRITHAHSAVLDELMKTGKVDVKEDEETWERLRSAGMSWRDLTIRQVENPNFMGHMALLRNLRNIFNALNETSDIVLAQVILKQLVDGVPSGKQFPFRYESAYDAVKKEDIAFKTMVLDALEECLDASIDNLPKLKGKTIALSDNSGSAWGAFTSEYGTKVVAEIDNLSAVIAAKCADMGEVGAFGDRLKMYPVSKRNGALIQAKEISSHRGHDVGHATEGGIWIFFRDLIDQKKHVDNIFIFSDMQAGTGQLYGEGAIFEEYVKRGFRAADRGIGYSRYSSSTWFSSRRCVDVYKLINAYRAQVNPKVNVFCVQTAGYTNTIMPILSYRTAFLAGWTGKEVQFADKYIREWDAIEASKNVLANN